MSRPVHAVILPPGRRLFDRLATALDDGPAICPLSPDLPAPALRAVLDILAPAAVETTDGITRTGTGEPSDAAVLIATSGSTGSPKIAELPAAALRHGAAATLARLGAAPGDRWLCTLPTSHIAGIQVLVRAIVSGTDPIIREHFDVTATMTSGARHIAVVPTQLRRMLDQDLSTFATILLGGAAAPPGLVPAAQARGARVVTTYGMSETCGGCVYDGTPLDGVTVRIRDDGRIALAGPVLFSGYRRRPARRGDWFVTGDLGELTDGVLRVRGRADDVINTGGEKVVAGEVERVLHTHPAVKDAVVVGRPDPEWGELVTAFVVATTPVTLGELRDHVRQSLPAAAAPRALELLDELPMLASGKPDRQALRT